MKLKICSPNNSPDSCNPDKNERGLTVGCVRPFFSMVPKPNSYSRHSHAKPVYFCAKPTTQPSRSPYPLPVHIIAYPIRPVQTPQNRHFPLKTGFSRNWWGLIPSKVDQEIGLGLKNTSGVALIAKPRWRKKNERWDTFGGLPPLLFFSLIVFSQ